MEQFFEKMSDIINKWNTTRHQEIVHCLAHLNYLSHSSTYITTHDDGSLLKLLPQRILTFLSQNFRSSSKHGLIRNNNQSNQQQQRPYNCIQTTLTAINKDEMASNTSIFQSTADDYTSFHMKHYMRTTILPKAGNFGSGTPRIVQDNARSFFSPYPKRNRKKKTYKSQKARKTNSPRSVCNMDLFRGESSNGLFTHATLPMHPDHSNHRSQQKRWSNGMVDRVKEVMNGEDRCSNKQSLQINLTDSLARDLNISNNTDPRQESSSINSMHSNPRYDLIRPERIPSSECFWHSEEHRSIRLLKSQPTTGLKRNCQWDRIPKPVTGECPSLTIKKEYTTPQA